MLHSILAISLGASIGAVMRWLLGLSLNSLFPTIPPGTLVANMLGGYLVGVAVAFFAGNPDIAPEWRLMIITGFLGGLTTFSTFSSEITTLIQQGRLIWAGIAISAHVGGSLLMTILGIASMSLLKRI